MLALVARGSSETGLELVEVEEPRPRAGEALVEVRAVSLNRGEVRRLADAEAGERPGWDVAGVVRRAAADGSGPREGTRVVGLTPGGGWAQWAAVPTDVLAALPDQVSDAQAAALPIAGLTALRALHRGGLLLGARVLVTGAAGGVGRFGVQLAGLAGAAEVHGVVGSVERAAGLAALGTTRVLVSGEDLDGPYDLILEGVGGPSLSRAAGVVGPGGTVVSYASSVAQPAELPPRWFGMAPRAKVSGLFIFDELAHTRSGVADLGTLAALVARGRLDPQVTRQASWRDAEPLLRALLDREVAGKAVLHVD